MASGRRKVTVVGAGMVGGTAAQILALRDYADVVLVDIVEGLPQGKALDLMQAGPLLGYDTNLTGTNGYEATAVPAGARPAATRPEGQRRRIVKWA